MKVIDVVAAVLVVVPHRHRVVRSAIGNARPRFAPRWAAAVALVVATMLQPPVAHAQTPPGPGAESSACVGEIPHQTVPDPAAAMTRTVAWL